MSKNIFIFLLLNFFVAGNLFGQGEANIWYFGYGCGIDFNSGSAVAISGPIHTDEGCATICDSSGNLLFSTNGDTIFNSLGAVMDTGLYGSWTSTQSAIIVKFPNSNSKYYVFTADDHYYAGMQGICYSVVDMNLNGGLGGIVSMNTQLLSNATEKLTAVRNSTGSGFWVVAHAYPSNEFYSFPVTSSGVGSPVISAIGLPDTAFWTYAGYIKFSPNGQKLVNARYFDPDQPCELFDFDATTGIISNCILIPSTGYIYGASFSSDNSKFYLCNVNYPTYYIKQYDLTIPNFQNLPYTVSGGTSAVHGALQLAPDGKIYCSKLTQNTLGVINNPNLSGAACNYSDSGFILLSGTIAHNGLPNFIESYFQSCTLSISLSSNSDTIFSNVSGGALPLIYEWSDGTTTQNLTGMSNGSYSVTVTDANGCSESSNIKFVFALIVSSQNNFKIYPNPATEQLIIDNGQFTITEIEITDVMGRIVYEEQSHTQLSIIHCQLFPPGVYFIKLEMQNGEMKVMKFVKE